MIQEILFLGTRMDSFLLRCITVLARSEWDSIYLAYNNHIVAPVSLLLFSLLYLRLLLSLLIMLSNRNKDMSRYLKSSNAIDEILNTHGNEEAIKEQRELFRQTKDTKYRDGFNAYQKICYHRKVMEKMRRRSHDDTASIPAAQDPPSRETMRESTERSINLSNASANHDDDSTPTAANTTSVSASASISVSSQSTSINASASTIVYHTSGKTVSSNASINVSKNALSNDVNIKVNADVCKKQDNDANDNDNDPNMMDHDADTNTTHVNINANANADSNHANVNVNFNDSNIIDTADINVNVNVNNTTTNVDGQHNNTVNSINGFSNNTDASTTNTFNNNTNNLFETDSDVSSNQQSYIESDSDTGDSTDEEEEEEEDSGLIRCTDERAFLFGCGNCRRKQSHVLINKYGVESKYCIQFELHKSDTIRSRRKFKFCHTRVNHPCDIILCSLCAIHLTSDDTDDAKSSKNVWPGFIWSLLQNKDLHSKYGNRIWKFIPSQWRHWWLSSVCECFPVVFEDITIDDPSPAFVDRTAEIDEWNDDIDSKLIARLADTCNKHLMPKILCPWGCSEYNHK